MRLALVADIHGNDIAFKAVTDDAARLGVDGYCALGDMAAIGPEPSAVLDRLVALPHLTAVRGNNDRYAVTVEGPRTHWYLCRRDPH